MALVNNSVCTCYRDTQSAVAITLLLFYGRYGRNAWGLDNTQHRSSEGRQITEHKRRFAETLIGVRRVGRAFQARVAPNKDPQRGGLPLVWETLCRLFGPVAKGSCWEMDGEREREGEGWGGVKSRGWALFPERTTNIWLSYFNFVPPSTSDHRESFYLRMAHVQWHLGRLSGILYALDWRRVGGGGEGSQEEMWHPSTQGCLPLGRRQKEKELEGLGLCH